MADLGKILRRKEKLVGHDLEHIKKGSVATSCIVRSVIECADARLKRFEGRNASEADAALKKAAERRLIRASS